MKSVVSIIRNVAPHWVGDGFPVRSLFSYHEHAEVFDPFLLLDYAGPHEFSPASAPRGVGEHPHRGLKRSRSSTRRADHRDSGAITARLVGRRAMDDDGRRRRARDSTASAHAKAACGDGTVVGQLPAEQTVTRDIRHLE
jgi:hypothetical protein